MKKIILIGGGSCSGKTTLSQIIQGILGEKTLIISQDNYFIDYSCLSEHELENENFDQPQAFKLGELLNDVVLLCSNQIAYVPLYDFKKRNASMHIIDGSKVEYIIIEGIMAMYISQINEMANLKIFVDTDMDIMLARRVQRDGQERFFDLNSTIKRYLRFVRVGYIKYILPTKIEADIVVNGNSTFDVIFIKDILNKFSINSPEPF